MYAKRGVLNESAFVLFTSPPTRLMDSRRSPGEVAIYVSQRVAFITPRPTGPSPLVWNLLSRHPAQEF